MYFENIISHHNKYNKKCYKLSNRFYVRLGLTDCFTLLQCNALPINLRLHSVSKIYLQTKSNSIV